MGDYPTLNDIDAAYGKDFSVEWMMPHIATLAIYTGAKNLTKPQMLELSRIIAAEYRHLKVTELMLFFYRFKAGHYGRFYGSVDPMVVTCALRDFMQERKVLIDHYEQQEREQKRDAERSQCISWEEYLKMKRNRGEDTEHNANPLKSVV